MRGLYKPLHAKNRFLAHHVRLFSRIFWALNNSDQSSFWVERQTDCFMRSAAIDANVSLQEAEQRKKKHEVMQELYVP